MRGRTTWRQREVESARQRLFSKHVTSPTGKKGDAPQKAYLRSFNTEEPKLDVQVSSMEKCTKNAKDSIFLQFATLFTV